MEDFERLKVIGKGSFGEVWLSRHKRDQKMYVLKKINLQRASRKERSSAEQEASLLQQLKHPNIVSYKQSFETHDGQLYIAMQYCEGGDLYTKLKEQRGALLEERQVVEWFVQIAMALQYMHERNILHRDLKTQNIFLTKSKIIKLGDLGIARVLEAATDMATTLIGTPYYMSPEIFSNKPYNHKSDVWSLGCCLYEMTTLKHAFNAKDMNSLVYKILKGKLPPMPQQYSQELLNMMRCMLHQDPYQRPSINRLLRDPYIRRNIAIFLEETRRGAGRRASMAAARKPASAASLQMSEVAAADQGIKRHMSEGDSARATPVSNLPPGEAQVSRPQSSRPSSARQQCGSDSKSSRSNAAPRVKPDKAGHPQGQRQEKKTAASQQSPHSAVQCLEDQETPVHHGRGHQIKDQQKALPRPKAEDTKEKGRVASAKSVPVPKAAKSEGLPQKRDQKRQQEKDRQSADSSSSKSSSFTENVSDDVAKSLPNLPARDRRRQDKASSSTDSARSIPKLRRVPEDPGSDQVVSKDKGSVLKVKSSQPKKQRQPSLKESSSSSDEDVVIPAVGTKEREQRREKKEINNFISVLDQTLKMNKEADKSEEEEEAGERAVSPSLSGGDPSEKQRQQTEEVSRPPTGGQKSQAKESRGRRSPPLPSVETLASTSRLMNRIHLLHKDCVQGIGYSDLKKAYEILDHIDDGDVEPKMMALLGKEKFDKYAIKIWQLKFCEESFFMC